MTIPIRDQAFTFQLYEGQVSLPTRARVDGPRDLRYRLGLDRNQNSRLDPEEALPAEELWYGRSVRSQLLTTKEGFAVDNSVLDVSVPVDVTGLVGRQSLIAAVQRTSEVCELDVRLYILASAPQVDMIAPAAGATVAAGQELEVVLQGQRDSAGAIDQVSFGFDKNGDGKLQEKRVSAASAGGCGENGYGSAALGVRPVVSTVGPAAYDGP